MEKSNLIKRGFYTALTAGFFGLGLIYGCKDAPTGPLIITIEPEPNPPTIELSVSPSSGISPLETYVAGKCEDPDNDIVDYRVMKGNNTLTRTNPTDTTINLNEGKYLFYSKCRDGAGNEVTSDTSYIEVTRPPEPEKSLSQTADLSPPISINYTATLINIPEATRKTIRNDTLINTKTITAPNYSETLEDMAKGNYMFVFEADSVVKPDTTQVNVPDYASKAPDLSGLNLGVNERDSIIVHLKRARDDNKEDNPVHYTGVIPSGVEASLGTFPNDTVLTIKAPEIPGPDSLPYSIGLMREGSLDTINLEGRVLDIPGPAPDQLAVSNFGCVMVGCMTGEIFVLDENGKNQRRLTNNSYQDLMPTWFPDGSKIAYLSNRTFEEGGGAIWVVDMNGNENRLFGGLEAGLREGEVSDSTWWNDGIILYPSYSPDGGKIAFTYLHIKENSAEDRHGIAVWNGGDSFDFLTSDPCPRCFSGGNPSWSPDGSKIVFGRLDDVDGIRDIWMINKDGSGQEKIYSSGAMPDWSLDGLHIAFSSAPTGGGAYEPSYIYTLKISDGSITQITNNPDFRDIMPDWSPDGSRIAFRRGNRCYIPGQGCGSKATMKVIDIDTGEITQPIPRPPGSFQPGEYLIYPGMTEYFAWRPRQ